MAWWVTREATDGSAPSVTLSRARGPQHQPQRTWVRALAAQHGEVSFPTGHVPVTPGQRLGLALSEVPQPWESPPCGLT